MHILAARPSEGKSTMLLNWLVFLACYRETPALLFSLEMKGRALAGKIIAAEGQVDHTLLRRAKLGEADWRQVTETCAQLAGRPLYVDDSRGLTVDQLAVRARRAVRKHGVKVIGPGLSDLKESGALEEDADQVMFIYHPGGELKSGVKELIVRKNRLGPVGTALVWWEGEHQLFRSVGTHEAAEYREAQARGGRRGGRRVHRVHRV